MKWPPQGLCGSDHGARHALLACSRSGFARRVARQRRSSRSPTCQPPANQQLGGAPFRASDDLKTRSRREPSVQAAGPTWPKHRDRLTVPNIPTTYWTFPSHDQSFKIVSGAPSRSPLLWLPSARGAPQPPGGWRMPPSPLHSSMFADSFDSSSRGRPPALARLRPHEDGRRSLAELSAIGEVITSLVVFTLLYGSLAVIEIGLLPLAASTRRPRPSRSHGPRRPGTRTDPHLRV